MFCMAALNFTRLFLNILCQVEALQQCSGNGVFKFEAFVLHTQCRSLQDAQLMVT